MSRSLDMISLFRATLESYWVAIAPFQAFADSSHGGIVERHVQCARSPMHRVESAALSSSSRLHSSMKIRSRN